eukprot:s98_g8.t2
MDLSDVQQQMSSGLNFGVMNALRTGNPILDVMVCMLIPVVLSLFMGNSNSDPMSTKIKDSARFLYDFVTGTKTYIRRVEYEDRGVRFMGGDDRTALETSARNNILQKAIKLYMQEKCTLDIDDAEVYLIPQKEAGNLHLGASANVKLEKDQYGDNCVFSGSYKQLMAYSVNRLPRKDHWIPICASDPPLHFRQSLEVNEEGEGQGRVCVRTFVFELRARGKKARAKVDQFIDDAFEFYKTKKGEETDKSRYLYQPILSSPKTTEGGSDDESDKARKYKRYLLSDAKNFDTLFFPEKSQLLKLVDDFMHARGKFAIPGFPNKLGILLDGPPGTGKTSLIKALAIYLKRHIVSVSLEKVKTNQELMDMMFDLSYSVSGEDEPFKMKFSEVIFVMEDVDCASKVVYARKGASAAAAAQAGSILAAPALEPLPEDGVAGAGGSGPLPGGPLPRAASAPVTPLDPAALKRNAPFSVPQMLRQVSRVASEEIVEEESEVQEEEDDDDDEPEEEVAEVVVQSAEQSSTKSKLKSEPELDRLNLSGLLNVLDGVVDTPGRVVVMTTNHPEKLDPALIRPGRINKRIHLGFVDAETLLKMAKHYVCRDVELPGNAKADAERLCSGGRGITPAWVEQCSAESHDFESFVKQLKVLKNASLPGVPAKPPVERASKRW